MIPMIICKMNKNAMHQVKSERQVQFNNLQAELNPYKHEYEKLNNDMPDIIPDYISQTHDAYMKNDTIDFGAEYSTRTKLDAKFLIYIIEQKDS